MAFVLGGDVAPDAFHRSCANRLSAAGYVSTRPFTSLPTWYVMKRVHLCQSDKRKTVSPVVLICISLRRWNTHLWIHRSPFLCIYLPVNCSVLCCWAVSDQFVSLYVRGKWAPHVWWELELFLVSCSAFDLDYVPFLHGDNFSICLF